MNSIEYILQGLTLALVLVVIAGAVGAVIGWLL
jgi:hypothetical protein